MDRSGLRIDAEIGGDAGLRDSLSKRLALDAILRRW
jgi:hypothetical protein